MTIYMYLNQRSHEMAIIKYTLDNKAIPSYISDGGYWGDVDDSTLIGVGEGGGETISK